MLKVRESDSRVTLTINRQLNTNFLYLNYVIMRLCLTYEHVRIWGLRKLQSSTKNEAQHTFMSANLDNNND